MRGFGLPQDHGSSWGAAVWHRAWPAWGGGLLIGLSRVPRALPGRHRPSRRDRGCSGLWLLDLGDRPGEAGELAGGGDGDDRASLGAQLEACPGAV